MIGLKQRNEILKSLNYKYDKSGCQLIHITGPKTDLIQSWN